MFVLFALFELFLQEDASFRITAELDGTIRAKPQDYFPPLAV